MLRCRSGCGCFHLFAKSFEFAFESAEVKQGRQSADGQWKAAKHSDATHLRPNTST